MKKVKKTKPTIGWREWLAFPELGIEAVKAKIDTGAKTSALHAMKIVRFVRDGKKLVRFDVHPFQRDQKKTITCEARLVDHRTVRSSSGHESTRSVVEVEIELMGLRFPIELTLTNRDQMGFRMLIGRQALRKRFLIDPSASFCDKTHLPKKRPRLNNSSPEE